MKAVDLASTALANRGPRPGWSRRRPDVRLSLLEAPLSLRPRKPAAEGDSRKDRKLMSLELDLGGFAVEFKAKSLSGLLTWLSLDLTLVAVIQELMRPRQFRTWHGRVAGLVPYDFRKPTLRRVIDALWAPDNPRLFTDTAFGVGWSLNLAQLPRALRGASRAAAPSYHGPKVTSAR